MEYDESYWLSCKQVLLVKAGQLVCDQMDLDSKHNATQKSIINCNRKLEEIRKLKLEEREI